MTRLLLIEELHRFHKDLGLEGSAHASVKGEATKAAASHLHQQAVARVSKGPPPPHVGGLQLAAAAQLDREEEEAENYYQYTQQQQGAYQPPTAAALHPRGRSPPPN